MGTRSLTTITSSWDSTKLELHATIYRHWDGYLSVHGKWLADFLADTTVTSGKRDVPKHYNGPGRLASAIVSQLQTDGHDPDLVPANSIMGQEFAYNIHCNYGMNGGSLTVSVSDGPMTMFGAGGEDCNNTIFSGTVPEFTEFITSSED